MSRAIEVTLAPFLPSFLISSILSTPIISSLAPNRRNRSNDNGRPNGMVGVPALRPETFPRSFPKTHRAQTRNTEAIKHIRGWARKIGPSCVAVVERIFSGVKVKEQAYNPALSVLNLSKRYGEDRLEAACAKALPRLTSPRYRHLKSILDSNLGDEPPAARTADGAPPGGHVRGADYYRELG